MKAAVLLLGLLIAGCGNEPDFDERYASAEQEIRRKAAEMDKELADREREAGAAAAPSVAATGQSSSSMKTPK